LKNIEIYDGGSKAGDIFVFDVILVLYELIGFHTLYTFDYCRVNTKGCQLSSHCNTRKLGRLPIRNERFFLSELKWGVWNTQPIFCGVFCHWWNVKVLLLSVLFITKCLLCDTPLSSLPRCSSHWCTFSTQKKTKKKNGKK